MKLERVTCGHYTVKIYQDLSFEFTRPCDSNAKELLITARQRTRGKQTFRSLHEPFTTTARWCVDEVANIIYNFFVIISKNVLHILYFSGFIRSIS